MTVFHVLTETTRDPLTDNGPVVLAFLRAEDDASILAGRQLEIFTRVRPQTRVWLIDPVSSSRIVERHGIRYVPAIEVFVGGTLCWHRDGIALVEELIKAVDALCEPTPTTTVARLPSPAGPGVPRTTER